VTEAASTLDRLGRIWRLAVSDGTPGRALQVALVVGTILNLINQGEAMLSKGEVHFGKALLTYLVPFVVSTHGAVMARLRHERSR
jgi:hypothetical protein